MKVASTPVEGAITVIELSTLAEDGPRPRVRLPRFVVVVLGALVIVAALVAVNLFTGHGNPDPGGQLLDDLRTVKAAIPPDAIVSNLSETEPRWDSCDGRPETEGWSSAAVTATFTTLSSIDDVFAGADWAMADSGWTKRPTGPLVEAADGSAISLAYSWTKTFEGRPETASLGFSRDEVRGMTVWDLSAFGVAAGPVAHGC